MYAIFDCQLWLGPKMSDVILNNGQLQLVVCPQIGGAVRQFTLNAQGQNHLVFRDSINAQDIHGMAFFPLAPFASRVQDGRFSWDDKSVVLTPNLPPEPHALHGKAWQSQWQVKSQTEDCLVLVYKHSSDEWPWDYEVELCYELVDLTLNLTLTTTNHSDSEMPSGLGLHPYFAINEHTRVKVAASKMWQMDETLLPIGKTDSPAELLSEQGAVASDMIIDNVLINDSVDHEVVWTDSGIRAKLSSTGCNYTVMYRPPAGDFICIEPISHCANALTMAKDKAIKHGITPLAPGASHRISKKIELVLP